MWLSFLFQRLLGLVCCTWMWRSYMRFMILVCLPTCLFQICPGLQKLTMSDGIDRNEDPRIFILKLVFYRKFYRLVANSELNEQTKYHTCNFHKVFIETPLSWKHKVCKTISCRTEQIMSDGMNICYYFGNLPKSLILYLW